MHHPHHHYDNYRGWVRPGGRRGRWLEPFVLLLVAQEVGYGRALIGRLNELCLAPDGVNAGMAYRTLRELEADGLMTSAVGRRRRGAAARLPADPSRPTRPSTSGSR